MADFDATIRQVQDTMTVMAGIQARQAEVLRGYGEWLEEHTIALRKSDERMNRLEIAIAGIGDKLNALIGVVDGWRPRPPAGT